MSNPAVLGAISWEAESSWAEAVDTWATDRVAVLESVDISGLTRDVLEPNRVVQYRNDGTPYIEGVRGGSFKTKVYWTGHGSTMVGSPTIGAHEDFIALAFGSAANLSASASTTLTGGTAAVPTTTASGTFDAGGLCRVGALGDGDGNGQVYAITTNVTTSLTLRGELDGAPANGAVLYPVVQFGVPESPTGGAITGTRFLIQTANYQVKARGCFPMSAVTTGLNPGELPMLEITWGVSWWDWANETFPTTTASVAGAFNPGAIANGSLNVQDVGTTTRATRSYRNLTLTHTLGVEPLKGPGGVSTNQVIVGAMRVPDTIELEWTEDAGAASTTPTIPGWALGTFKHVEFTGSVADGSVFAFACPRMCVATRPSQAADGNINRITAKLRAHTSTVTTNALTLSAIVYGSA